MIRMTMIQRTFSINHFFRDYLQEKLQTIGALIIKGGVRLKKYFILILVLFVLIAAIGFQIQKKSKKTFITESKEELLMTEKETEDSKEKESETEQNDYLETATYPEESIIPEDQITPEKYTQYDEIPLECYFTNTENTIDAGDVLPLYAHSTIVKKTQIYLNEQGMVAGELYCVDGSVVQNGEKTSFQVICVDAENQKIELTYYRSGKTWSFRKIN